MRSRCQQMCRGPVRGEQWKPAGAAPSPPGVRGGWGVLSPGGSTGLGSTLCLSAPGLSQGPPSPARLALVQPPTVFQNQPPPPAAQPLQLVKPGGADTGDSGRRAALPGQRVRRRRGRPGKGLGLLHRRPEVRVSKMPVGMTKLELAGRSSALSLGPLTREEKALKTGMGRERAILGPHEGTSCSWVVVKHQETNLCQTPSLSLLPSQTQRSSLSPPRIIRRWYSCAAINQSCFPAR